MKNVYRNVYFICLEKQQFCNNISKRNIFFWPHVFNIQLNFSKLNVKVILATSVSDTLKFSFYKKKFGEQQKNPANMSFKELVNYTRNEIKTK